MELDWRWIAVTLVVAYVFRFLLSGPSRSTPKSAAATLVGKKVPDIIIQPVGGGKKTSLSGLLGRGLPLVIDMYTEW